MRKAFAIVLVMGILAFCPSVLLHAEDTPMEFTEEMGASLATLVIRKAVQFDSLLSAEEKVIYYSLLPHHLHDLYKTDDWERFESAIEACNTVDDLRRVMQEDFVGITEAAPGRPQMRDIHPLADAILDDANL